MKRIAVDKAQAQVVAILAGAAVISIFSLMFARTLWSQQGLQNKLIGADQTASKQLSENLNAADQLIKSYDNFESQATNIIGGSSSGTGPNDGDNATIVLDALPSQYDFPALASSITKILTSQNLTISNVSGTDNESTESNVQPSDDPAPVAMPFSLTVTNASYDQLKTLIKTFEESIRPIQIQSIQLSGSESTMSVSITAQTYFQPGKIMGINKEAIQ